MCYRNVLYGGFLDSKHTWKSDVEKCLQEISNVYPLCDASMYRYSGYYHTNVVFDRKREERSLFSVRYD
jgi:hypothetical protein